MKVKRKYKINRDVELAIFKKGRKAQPAGLFAIFSMIGIAVLFIMVMVMFAVSAPGKHLGAQNFPWLFYLSTPVIVLASYTIEKTKRAFRTDNADDLLRYQAYTLAISIIFSVIQFFAWQQLWDSEITMTMISSTGDGEVHSNSGAYLFVLSALHLVHLSGGLFFLFTRMFRLVNNREDIVKAVIYFSDKQEGSRISALALYWHFLAGLWCIMFLFFLWYFI